MPLAPGETSMWEGDLSPPPPETSNAKIDAKYEVQGRKLVLESNREKLQNFYEALKRPGYMDLQPFFQRRPRWTDDQKSRFIESFIINIPVPPLFLFEIKPNAYEVIDGQQRIRAIQDFFSGDLELQGLVHWPELNGRRYGTLPSGVKAGIERRSISYSIVMRESAANDEEAAFIKRTVFERLNTGGARMTAQEIRNSVYGGDFNKLIRELSEEAAFRAVWAPTYGTAKVREHERNLVQGMIDVEQVWLAPVLWSRRSESRFNCYTRVLVVLKSSWSRGENTFSRTPQASGIPASCADAPRCKTASTVDPAPGPPTGFRTPPHPATRPEPCC